MTLDTAFTQLVGCSVPIQQAPMGPVAGPELVGAVAQAGGLGTLTTFGHSPEQLATIFDGIRHGTSGAIGANFLTDEIDREALEVVAARVRVVDFFWSRPEPSVVEIAHAGGAIAGWQVGSAEDAKRAADAGCDFVAAQGIEAGGHIAGELPLLLLLDQVLDTVSVPVLAAGAVGSARGLAAVLAAGAAGARIGTRFLATVESAAHDRYKQALIAARGAETEITGEFSVMCPLCALRPRTRVLSSALTAARAFQGDIIGEIELGGSPVALPKFVALPPDAQTTGEIEAMVLYAGMSVDAVTRIVPAAQLIDELVSGAQSLLSGW